MLLGATAQAATTNVGPWVPIFSGIELASGQWTSGSSNQRVLCLRVDLTDPDIELFTTPKCTNCGSYETLAQNTSHFLEQYGVQVAINGGFYASSSGPGDVPLGTPEDVLGLAISKGTLVSSNQTTPVTPQGYLLAVMMFSTNNQAAFFPSNNPAASTAGIYTAVAGNRALLVGGTNRMVADNDLDPRTAVGLSADRRSLFLLTIDGRQPGWSDGANFHDTAEWLRRFGASDGLNLDGGGSTTMSMANCVGAATRLNRSSFVAAYGRERNIGQNFGVSAKPLPTDLKNLSVDPGNTTAIITWQTDLPGTTQVEYGLTTNYGSATPLDTRPLRHHVATLAGLAQGSNYYFLARSIVEGAPLEVACQFSTLRLSDATLVLPLNTGWKYATNNLDGVNWRAPAYPETGWALPSPALLVAGTTDPNVQPKNSVLPMNGASVFRTYYFRTHFAFSGSTNGLSLVFSNYVDDGAVFYLNGAEIYRLRMPAAPTVILNSTAAIGLPCAGTPQAGNALPTCPDVFTISGSLLTNLAQGDNVLAVEAHNYSTGNDVVFGSALIQVRPRQEQPELNLWREGDLMTLFWNGEGYTLQQATDLAATNRWTDVAGPVSQSPFNATNGGTTFYRLRN